MRRVYGDLHRTCQPHHVCLPALSPALLGEPERKRLDLGRGRCQRPRCRGAYADYRAQRRADGKDRPAKAGRLDTDGHVSRRWFRDTIGKPALAAAGITRRLRIHDLRHAHACWLLAGGADVQTARERLGHAGVGVGCAVIVPELSRSTQ